MGLESREHVPRLHRPNVATVHDLAKLDPVRAIADRTGAYDTDGRWE